MRNIRLLIAFDGTPFHGWQRQQNALSVQQVLEDTLTEITRSPTDVIGVGRTDAGVHAQKYTCNFQTECAIPTDKIPLALNALLPDSIVVLAAKEEPLSFHSRFDALGKHYRYQILNSRCPNPFLRDYAFFYPQPLDIPKMHRAAQDLLGTHDFSAFCSAGATVKTTVRTIYRAEVAQKEELVTLDLYGNGFLYNMVRIITGTLLYVGNGKLPADCIPKLIAGRKRKNSGITVPPQGLFLMEAFYEGENAPDYFTHSDSAHCHFHTSDAE